MAVALAMPVLAAGMLRAASAPPSAEGLELFEKKIQPIFVETCYKCHSHDAEKIKGDLLLDSNEATLTGGASGPALVPGKPDESLLVTAIRYTDRDLQMPPEGEKLSDEQIAAITEWVRLGAPRPETSADRMRRRRTTATDTSWWSFQPLTRPSIPEVKNTGWSGNPVDRFILAKLETKGLAPSAEADRRTLIRRVYFDVTGLPPSAEEVQRFVADRSPDAYEKVVDQLLASPRYGEKWARHWLDLVRFAESDGFKLDEFRPTAWRYRDYVIRSFNEDKPYNRFLMEQVAADELWPDNPDAVVGTGYLRQTIYEYNQRDVTTQWRGIINDITDVTSDAFLGLGMQCARCHDHKFDPILQKDYFRLRAFFAPLSQRDDLPLATPAQLAEYKKKRAVWEDSTAAIRGQIDALERPVRESTAKGVIEKFPKDIQAIMTKPAAERTPLEQQINDLAYNQVTFEFKRLDGKFKGTEKEQLDALNKALTRYDELKPRELPTTLLVTDVGPVAPLNTIPKRSRQAEDILPGFLSLLDPAPAKVTALPTSPGTTGRRAVLAQWLAQPDNRFTTRVMVNRVWQRLLGRGIVATPSDFGHLGDKPTHPELLDWLTGYFIDHNWSVKALQRLILTSATYRQSALTEPSEVARTEDPDNQLLWRMRVRRLEAEEIRDSMLLASGELDLAAGGPSVDPSKPRRTVYTRWLRNSRDPLLEVFDPPDAYTGTAERNVTVTPSQALMLINGQYALQRAKALATRISQSRPAGEAAAVTAAYGYALGRTPTAKEQSHAVGFIESQAHRIEASGSKDAAAASEEMPRRGGSRAALLKPTGLQTRLVVPDNPLMPSYDFTVEAYVVLRSVEQGAGLRTIVSRWDGRKDQPGWSFGVTGFKSAFDSQTLALELIGDPAEDGGGYEAIPSGLRLELDTPYYAAVTVRIGDTSESGVTFYLKELTTGSTLLTAKVPHKVTASHQSNLPLAIGAREPEKQVVWDGLVDDVRLSRAALAKDDLLVNREGTGENTVGYWNFEEPNFFKDSSPNGHAIRSEIAPTGRSDSMTAALNDFCHLLFNANEFLYLD